MTSTAVDVYARSPLPERARYAQTLADAADLIPRGLFDRTTGRPSPAKILLVMETGTMLGLHPMAAIASIDVIEGKAVIAPRAALGLIRGRGHKVRIVEEGSVETGDLKATVILTRHDDPENPISASYTPHMAARAGLCTYTFDAQTGLWTVKARSDKGKVLPWEAYTEDMCLWRAVGRIGRRGAEDVLMGIDYFPEELEVMVNEEGVREVISEETEAEYITRMQSFDDREQMRELYREIRKAEAWTPKLTAAFDAHLMTLTKDSNPPETPSPGKTGDDDFDATTESGAAEAEPGHQEDTTATLSTSPEPTPNASQGHTAAEETEEQRFERESREAFDREMAANADIVEGVIVDE